MFQARIAIWTSMYSIWYHLKDELLDTTSSISCLFWELLSNQESISGVDHYDWCEVIVPSSLDQSLIFFFFYPALWEVKTNSHTRNKFTCLQDSRSNRRARNIILSKGHSKNLRAHSHRQILMTKGDLKSPLTCYKCTEDCSEGEWGRGTLT